MQIELNGIPVSYSVSGSGAPALVLPGWSATGAVYDMIRTLLAEKFTVYMLEMPGFGVTPEPHEPWTVDDYADLTAAFIAALGLDGLTLVGHSYGGRVIFKLCARELPFTMREVVLIDAAGVKHPLSPEAQARQDKFKKLKKRYSGKLMQTLAPHALEKLQAKYGSADYAAASPVMKQTLVKSISEDLTDLIGLVRAPALIIWGRDDTATPVSDAELMAKMIPGSELHILDGAGHFPFLDQPFEFRKILKDHYHLS